MLIELTNKEFQNVRKFVGGLEEPSVTKFFNELFISSPRNKSGKRIYGYVNPVSKLVDIVITEDTAVKFQTTLFKYLPVITSIIQNGFSITKVGSYVGSVKGFIAELKDVFEIE